MTNAQILTAVLLKWGEPVIPLMMGKVLNGVSSTMLPVEKFLKSVGVVGPAWQISGEINSLASIGGARMVRPFLERFLSRIPDPMIPQIAHEYVDSAIKNGKISILDEYFTFDRNDLVELKKYLDCNLPYQREEEYVVKVPQEQPKPAESAPHAQPAQQPKNDTVREREEK